MYTSSLLSLTPELSRTSCQEVDVALVTMERRSKKVLEGDKNKRKRSHPGDSTLLSLSKKKLMATMGESFFVAPLSQVSLTHTKGA